jgi:hypothetical protein
VVASNPSGALIAKLGPRPNLRRFAVGPSTNGSKICSMGSGGMVGPRFLTSSFTEAASPDR